MPQQSLLHLVLGATLFYISTFRQFNDYVILRKAATHGPLLVLVVMTAATSAVEQFSTDHGKMERRVIRGTRLPGPIRKQKIRLHVVHRYYMQGSVVSFSSRIAALFQQIMPL